MVVWLNVMEGKAIVVAEGPVWRIAAVWGLRLLAVLPIPITAIYVVKSQLAYGVVDVSLMVTQPLWKHMHGLRHHSKLCVVILHL